ASVVLRHKNYPAFLGATGEENTLKAFVEPISLEKNTYLLLKVVTELHEEFGSNPEKAGDENAEIHNPSENGRMNLGVYKKFLKNNFRRVLPQSFKDAIARMTAAELAALVLAMEAGKSLAFKQEKAGFVKNSVFPHLSSRAVLHSAPGFSDCFDSPARERLRRAITYASRYNNFGLVRLPVDLELATRACRQWTELMLASPNELQVVSDEVELFGIISLANLNFARIFIQEIASLRHFENAEAYTSGTNLLLFPMKKLIEVLYQAIDISTLRRLDELVYLVSQKQMLQEMSIGSKRDEELPSSPFRILRPIPFSDIKQLAELHDISVDVLKDWSSLRVILNSFSWLARRVGNSSVPDSSLVLALMRCQGISPSSEGSIISKKGMVPLRGSRLRQHFGPSWQKHFIYVDAVTMAESNEDLGRLMGLGARAFLDEEDDLGDLEKD
ncbi:MAG: hypothetical protein GYA55_06585, partial [SAR324 cluster bacterium]|nr:hypothetical protein [SAR324 cluster bacterium]